jgi:hypothetical protein
MACLNTDADKNGQAYKNFDIENMQPDQHANGNSSTAAAAAPRKNGSNRRGCCSLPLLLGIAALLLSLVALAFGIYGAVVARALVSWPSGQGVYLTTNPRDAPSGYQAVNLFKVIDSRSRVGMSLSSMCDVSSWAVTCTWQQQCGVSSTAYDLHREWPMRLLLASACKYAFSVPHHRFVAVSAPYPCPCQQCSESHLATLDCTCTCRAQVTLPNRRICCTPGATTRCANM